MTDWSWRTGSAPYIPPATSFSERVRLGGPVWLYGTEDGSAWVAPESDADE